MLVGFCMFVSFVIGLCADLLQMCELLRVCCKFVVHFMVAGEKACRLSARDDYSQRRSGRVLVYQSTMDQRCVILCVFG